MKQLTILCLVCALFACNGSKKNTVTEMENLKPKIVEDTFKINAKATFGGGCFWCIETIFAQLKGVDTVISGYAGGSLKNPTYKAIGTGNTGHAEVIQISYDSNIISFTDLLEVFFNVHDPTTLNRQGNDVGTQYRSAIMYHNEEQQKTSKQYISQIDSSAVFNSKIVTTLEKLDVFYPAEDYHQDYYNQNGEQGYCQYVVRPKVEKFQKKFKSKLK